jgi:hypothetical protein
MATASSAATKLVSGFALFILASNALAGPVLAPPLGRPLEVPSFGPVRPKSEFRLPQQAETPRRLLAGPVLAPPTGRAFEVPSSEPVRPKSEFRLPQQAETPRRPLDEQGQHQRPLPGSAVRLFEEFGKQGTYSAFDGQPDALRDFLQSDPTAQRINLASWRFTTRPTLSEFDGMLKLARTTLPGKVELGMFLDAKTYGESYKSITNAWGPRLLSEPPSASDLLSDYLSSHHGNTLITVGHVEGDSYVFENTKGEKVSVNIKELLIQAHNNQVVLIPIGCSTADAGVGFGFIREIGTDAVSSFLKSFPKDSPQTADVLSGLVQIGQVRVNIRDAANLFEIEVYKSETDEPITRTRIPYNLPTSNSAASPQASSSLVQTVETNAEAASPQASSSLVQTVETNTEEARPLFRKHWIVEILTDPLTYVELWVGLFIVSWVGSNLIRRWVFERRDRQWLYSLVRLPVNVTRYVFVGTVLVWRSVSDRPSSPLWVLRIRNSWTGRRN